MLAVGIRYLTGYAIATDSTDRERAEWPPHPARVFMAMAAAMFETGEDGEERRALEWLERQNPPAIKASEFYSRQPVTHYVPINDSSAPVKNKKALSNLQSVPIGRGRQPRTFPRVRPCEDTVFLVWPDAAPGEHQRRALDRLCEKVTRIGHSSSLVQMWVELNPPEFNLEPAELGEQRFRVVGDGTLEYLVSVFNRDNIMAYAKLAGAISSAKGARRNLLKQELEDRFGDTEPSSLRPAISQWQGYRRVIASDSAAPTVSGLFDREFMVLTIEEGPVVGLESTWQLLTTLHKTILATCDPAPEWLSGHTPGGKPSLEPHAALFPLAFVGREHADGHLMGIGLAMPRNIATRERGRALRGLLYDDNGRSKPVQLIAGSLGAWTLRQENRPTPAITLQPRTWTSPSDTWATVTPIVLDRHPKADRAKDREQWSVEVADAIAESCERQGLPRPVAVDVDKTSWHRGAPRALAGKGAGYPPMPVKQGQASRQQVHAWLRFAQPVEGPLLLGAGRFRGYGLCKPWSGRT